MKIQMRKFVKQKWLLIALAVIGTYLFFTHAIFSKEPDNKEKIFLMEESINSLANQEPCKSFPNLPVESPEMMKFMKDEEPIECGDEDDDWVSCDLSVCSVKKSVIDKKGSINCDFTDIIRADNDFKWQYGDTTKSVSTYELQKSDFARVQCYANNGDKWTGKVIGIRNDEQIIRRKGYNRQPQLSVLMLGFDSLSKNAWIRKLPKTYKYLTKFLGGDVLQGYNIVGDGTPQALTPILTGFTELELPEVRRRKMNSDYLDVYPMVWGDYQKSGYITAFNEDQPNIGTFSYRLNGFKEQPTDHYIRPYFLAIESDLHYYKKLCVGAQPKHKMFLDYTKSFMMKYSQPKFVFSFHAELSHDSINLIGVADNDLVNWLMGIKSAGILNDTVLILMSDHGNRFAEIRNTLQGKQEERLPFFSFTFPEWFKTEFRTEYANFKKNLNVLTTPFDIHATLEDILFLSQKKSIKKPLHSRAISLFDKIPENRSCALAYIEPHWCSCLNWESINDTTSEEVFRAANTLVEFINKYTQNYRKICEVLVLEEILWSGKLTPHKKLLEFKQNKDMDGFIPDLTSDTKILNEMYQVKILVSPSEAIYEASVIHNLVDNVFKVKLSDISRVNKYGNQARCIYEENPELRKYCYCK